LRAANTNHADTLTTKPIGTGYGTSCCEDGTLEATSELGQVLVEGLKLDHPEYCLKAALELPQG
jgi:hypothetical protein